jgi:hypothetical protein
MSGMVKIIRKWCCQVKRLLQWWFMQSEKTGCSSENSDTGHIIESLPDTDFYKFTMEQVIFDKGIDLSYRLSDK